MLMLDAWKRNGWESFGRAILVFCRRGAVWAAMLISTLHGCERSASHPSGEAGQLEVAQPAGGQLPRIDLAGLQALVASCDQDDVVLVIDFWASWCRPCVELFPSLHEGVKRLGSRVRMVSVTLDAPGLYEQRALNFLRSHHALHDAYLLVPEGDARLQVVSALGRRWRDLVVPAILIYDRDGRLAAEFLGGLQGQDPIITKVTQLLASGD